MRANNQLSHAYSYSFADITHHSKPFAIPHIVTDDCSISETYCATYSCTVQTPDKVTFTGTEQRTNSPTNSASDSKAVSSAFTSANIQPMHGW
jgi:hypothetical protein